MLKLILSFLLTQLPTLVFAQTISGQVLSSSTGTPFAGVTIRLLLSKVVAQTNDFGEFVVRKNSLYEIDTLSISYLGYTEIRIATNLLPKGNIFDLHEDPKSLRGVDVIAGKTYKAILGAFSYADVAYTLQMDTAQSFVSAKFPIAKMFVADSGHFKVDGVEIGRFVENANHGKPLFYDLKRHNPKAIFNLYFVKADATGKPEPLPQALKVPVNWDHIQAVNRIDLTRFGIKPEQQVFYIAIEWLPILPNRNYSIGKRGHPLLFRQFSLPVTKIERDSQPNMLMVYETGYEPYISTYSQRTSFVAQRYAWVNDRWIFVEPSSDKFEAELAISVDISYVK